jgi:hypothetical protein
MNRSLRHPKRRGEWVELQFMARAHAHGLVVSKPWGDSARYDFVVESPTKICHPEQAAPFSNGRRRGASKDPGNDRSTQAAAGHSGPNRKLRSNPPETSNQQRETRFLRVQVKSTMQTAKHKNGPPGAYLCNTISRGPNGRLQTYSSRDVDFFALFVIPLDLWYIIPLGDLPKATYALLLDTTRPGNKYFKYLEAWHLLR